MLRSNQINPVPDNLDTNTLDDFASLPEDQKLQLGVRFTPKEILQQPATWKKTFQMFEDRREDIQSFLDSCGLTGDANENIFVSLIGAGTSDYIGRSVRGILRSKWRCHVTVNPSTDLLTETDAFIGSSPANRRHIWVSFSRSGESFEGVRILEQAYEKYPDVRHIIVTCNSESRMANGLSKDRDDVLCLVLPDEVNDQGLAMTSSFTNMVVAGQCLANIDDLDGYRATIETLSQIANDKLPLIAETAREISEGRFERICFLGSGPLKGVAAESALKVLELSGGFYSTMAESFLGLRHGPLSWLNEKSLVVGLISNDPEKAKIELGLLAEVKKKRAAGRVHAIAPNFSESLSLYSDSSLVLSVPESLADDYLQPLYVIFAQCLGFFSSLSLGLKPDSPSADGKIQRVVSDIRIV